MADPTSPRAAGEIVASWETARVGLRVAGSAIRRAPDNETAGAAIERFIAAVATVVNAGQALADALNRGEVR